MLAKNQLSQTKRTRTSLKTMGIDFGERRIGVAISDPEGKLAFPFGVVERETDRRAVHQLKEIARRESVRALVVGDPLSFDGEAGAASERARRFGHKLGKVTRLPVHWIDEALTTVEANERLRAAGIDTRQDPARLDAVAAQILLQEALDQRQKEADS